MSIKILCGFIRGIVPVWVWDRFIWPPIARLIGRRHSKKTLIEEDIQAMLAKHISDHKKVIDERGETNHDNHEKHLEMWREFSEEYMVSKKEYK